MKRINLLDELISNKIAAGEVVERPASVVKELVENSIDAKAKHITVEIEEGGENLIRISDDGDGIHPDDIERAFLPHATSKIAEAEDLFNIITLGFRGEALASIASVSRVKLFSKIEEALGGKEVEYNGGIKQGLYDTPMNRGTIVEVRDLFYNVPARKKFLKSTSREAALIGDIINRIALANPDIAFNYINGGKNQFTSYGNGNLKDVIRSVYGKKIQGNLISFEKYGDELSIYGFIGNSEISRGSRNNQSIYVNKRYIKSRLITAAVENAFKSFATVNKFPFFILFIDIYPELIDVNVHPTKAEIKFKDERFIFKLVFDCIHEAIKQEVKDSFILPEEEEIVHEEKEVPITFDFTKEGSYKLIEYKKDDTPINESIKEKVNESIKEKEVNFDISREKTFVTLPVDLKRSEKGEDLPFEEKAPYKEKPALDFSSIRILGQFDKTYIVGEYNKTLYLIDQHAAHEKIMFERYTKEIRDHNVVIQPLLIPIVIELEVDDYYYFIENKELFNSSGFTIEEFGNNTIIIKEFPYVIGKSNCKALFLSILDNLKNMGSGKTEEYKYDTIARMACRSAVKAQEELTTLEMKQLLIDLSNCEEPFNCPHGRPTILKLSLYEMEKLFKRIQ